MIPTVLIAALFCLAVGIAVFAMNPRRFPNQAFTGGVLLIAVWLFIVDAMVAAEHRHAGYETLAFFARLNAAVVAFWPWTIWLMKESLLAERDQRLQTLRRSLPWLCFPIASIVLICLDSFVYLNSVGQLSRGWPYVACIGILCVGNIALVAQSVRQLRALQGIRRVELQFLSVNLAVAALVAFVLVGIGNVTHIAPFKWLSLVFVVVPYLLCAWSITIHRIFNARQIFLSLGQRAGLLTTGAVLLALGQAQLGRVMDPRIALVVVAIATGGAILWADRKLRAKLGLDGGYVLRRMREATIEISRTEASIERLVVAFEDLLRAECRTGLAVLVAEGLEVAAGLRPLRIDPCHAALRELGWATPESLQRRRATAGSHALQELVERQALGLVLAVPRGSPTPSLLVALGVKSNRGPFTFPEIEMLMNVAELMDNILARSRLTTQAAMHERTEHIAMMSRGLAHDLSNLITPISSFLIHIGDELHLSSVQADVHAHASRSVKVMQDYVRDAMFLGKQLAPKFQTIPLCQILETVRDIAMTRAVPRGVQVVIDMDSDAHLTADPLLIQRLLTNLVVNAIDASPAGASVSIAAEVGTSGQTRLRVTDCGSGISREDLPRVFDPYFTTKQYGENVRGFGLGLTICQKIVALHHGTIALESEPGRGTQVIVDLPAPAGSHAPAARVPAQLPHV